MSAVTTPFTGFRPEALQFLVDLSANNERSWFQPRKADYERLLKEPLQALCLALAERFSTRSIPLSVDPKRSPFRIYRDVRFSKDKSPYKTNIGAEFPLIGDGAASTGSHGVGGYFHLSPGEIFAGGGMWHPEPATLAAWRQAVQDRNRDVHDALDEPGFVATFGTLNGERFKRVPAGAPADHPDVELLKLKQLAFGRPLSDREVKSARLPDLMADTFVSALPFMRLLASLPR